jgi:hypothetical protein
MDRFTITAITAGALTSAALALAGPTAAAPTGGANAADAQKMLQDKGYNVQFNGTVRGPLYQCFVTDVHGLNGAAMSPAEVMALMTGPVQYDTVYLDVSCPGGSSYDN